jgi:hypothetical protein
VVFTWGPERDLKHIVCAALQGDAAGDSRPARSANSRDSDFTALTHYWNLELRRRASNNTLTGATRAATERPPSRSYPRPQGGADDQVAVAPSQIRRAAGTVGQEELPSPASPPTTSGTPSGEEA